MLFTCSVLHHTRRGKCARLTFVEWTFYKTLPWINYSPVHWPYLRLVVISPCNLRETDPRTGYILCFTLKQWLPVACVVIYDMKFGAEVLHRFISHYTPQIYSLPCYVPLSSLIKNFKILRTQSKFWFTMCPNVGSKRIFNCKGRSILSLPWNSFSEELKISYDHFLSINVAFISSIIISVTNNLIVKLKLSLTGFYS